MESAELGAAEGTAGEEAARPRPCGRSPAQQWPAPLLLGLGPEQLRAADRVGGASVRPAGRCPLCPLCLALSRGSRLCLHPLPALEKPPSSAHGRPGTVPESSALCVGTRPTNEN